MGTWTHPALSGGELIASRNDVVEQLRTTTLLLPAIRVAANPQVGYSPSSKGLQLSREPRSLSLTRFSRKRSQKRLHSVNQIVPGNLDGFLDTRQFSIVRIF
jgi:UV DNA damage repair endonuclease